MHGFWKDTPRHRQSELASTPSCPLEAGELEAYIAEVANTEAVRVAREGVETYSREVLPDRLKALGANFKAGKLTEDELLRRQCLEWAFQTREFTDVPHMAVVNVAEQYYDFIRNTEANQRRVAYFALGADEALGRVQREKRK